MSVTKKANRDSIERYSVERAPADQAHANLSSFQLNCKNNLPGVNCLYVALNSNNPLIGFLKFFETFS